MNSIGNKLDISGESVSHKSMRILLAEDDLTARTMLMGMLRKWGYETIAVKDGMAAWQALQQPESPRLVILDWMMPELDGLEVIRQVREGFTGQPPYIILLTSKDDKGDILSGLETGANDYIKKPFDHEELYARIRVGQRTLELQNKLYDIQRTLEHLSTHDPLTGIFNRRAILELLGKEISRAQREGVSSKDSGLSIGFLDIDHFKSINDRYSHQAGDEVLCELVRLLSTQMRVYDSIGRLGGDEFLIVAPGMDKEARQCLFERLTAAISAASIKTCAGEAWVTVSMGVANADSECCVEGLLGRADAAMYRAKREGGNRVAYAA